MSNWLYGDSIVKYLAQEQLQMEIGFLNASLFDKYFHFFKL
jgi:hypothetical protein